MDSGRCIGRLRRWTPALGVAALAVSTAAQAQAPSQVTPRDVRPPAQPPAAAAPLATAPANAPAGSETINVTVGEVVVEGGFPELADETAALTLPFRNRRSTVAELYGLAAALERAYAQAGYILVRVNPPPQKLADGGAVRLVVVDGFIEAADLAKVHPKLRRPVEMYVRPLIGRRRLRQAQLERQVLLAGQVAGALLTTALGRGEQPGGVTLVVNAGYDPFSGTVSLDNRMGEAFDRRALSVQASLSSALGRGEQVYGFLGLDPDLSRIFNGRAPRRVASLGASLPVGSGGVVVNPEATMSRTYPKPPEGAPATYGAFERYVLRVSWPIVLARGHGVDADLAFEASDERQTAYEFGFALSKDKLRIVRIGVDAYDGAFGPFSVRGRAEISRGIDGLGARTPEDAAASGVPLSRFGVTGDFTKLLLDGSVAVPAPFAATLQATFRAQLAIDGVMPSSELFALDAPNALSSFDAGATGADAGWTARLQLGRAFQPPAWGGRAVLSPYVYGAVGEAFYEVPFPGLITRANDVGVGLDARFLPPKGALRPFLTAEFGRHGSNGAAPDDTRFTVAAGVQF